MEIVKLPATGNAAAPRPWTLHVQWFGAACPGLPGLGLSRWRGREHGTWDGSAGNCESQLAPWGVPSRTRAVTPPISVRSSCHGRGSAPGQASCGSCSASRPVLTWQHTRRRTATNPPVHSWPQARTERSACSRSARASPVTPSVGFVNWRPGCGGAAARFRPSGRHDVLAAGTAARYGPDRVSGWLVPEVLRLNDALAGLGDGTRQLHELITTTLTARGDNTERPWATVHAAKRHVRLCRPMFRDGRIAPCKRTVSGSNPLTGSQSL
jgi:hypothetical protein